MGKRSSEVWPSLRANIEHSLDKTDPNGCWLWMGEKTPRGYGQVHWDGKSPYVHRSYLMELGLDVPKDMDVDHLCRNHSCCNPDHLEVVSHTENILRGVGYAAMNARKTHCIRGHEFTPENTYIKKAKGQTKSGVYLKRGLQGVSPGTVCDTPTATVKQGDLTEGV